jgi:hypothetical protein
MPQYVVTTTIEADNVVADALESVGTRVLFGGRPRTTRTVVATLDAAREAVEATMLDRDHLRGPEWVDVCGLAPDGGTIGPLPDGTVIEVRPA